MPKGVPKNGRRGKSLKDHICANCGSAIMVINITKTAICWPCKHDTLKAVRN